MQSGTHPGGQKGEPEPRQREQQRLALLRRIAGGDQTALAELYDACSGQVFGLAIRVLSDAGAAEDVTLEVFTQIWNRASSYDVSRGTPSAWILTLARSRAIDRLRSGAQERKRATSLEGVEATAAASGPDPERSAVDEERSRIVQEALGGLPTEQRELIDLAYFGGLSHSEIAARLNQPLGTVKTRIRAAMTHLRGALSDMRGEVG